MGFSYYRPRERKMSANKVFRTVYPDGSRKRVSRVIPFGFTKDPEDDTRLIPNEKEQEVINEARNYYLNNKVSMRNLAAWVQAHTGRKLSLQGLKKVMLRDY